MRDTLIIIPAYNEGKNIGGVLDSIQKAGCDADIVVVNDGSADNTVAVARKRNINVISLPYNLGYGAALQTGFKYAVRKSYSYCIQFDADGQHSSEDINQIQSELRKNEADMVIGSRFYGMGTFKFSKLKIVSIRMFRSLIKLCTGTAISDPTSGLKGLSKPLFYTYSQMGEYPNDFPDADILIRTVRNGFKVTEVPAAMQERMNGKGMHEGFGLKQAYYMVKIVLSILVVLIQEKANRKERDRNG